MGHQEDSRMLSTWRKSKPPQATQTSCSSYLSPSFITAGQSRQYKSFPVMFTPFNLFLKEKLSKMGPILTAKDDGSRESAEKRFSGSDEGSEAEDSLLGQPGMDGWTRKREPKLQFLPLLASITFGAILGAASLAILQRVSISWEKQISYKLPLMPIPELGPIQTSFEFEPIYYSPPTDGAANQAWADMIPMGRGFVSLSRLQEAGEVPTEIKEMDTSETGKYCVAVFHQLHCVNVLRHAYYHALEGKTALGNHVTHCLAYLRQSLKCAADTSLEPYKIANDGVDGFDSSRQCRDYEAVYHWAERFRYTDEEGIDNHHTHDGDIDNHQRH